MNGATKSFLRAKFGDYYSRRIDPPSRYHEREWGFIPFGEQMYRHKAFGSELNDYLHRNGPAHTYYSVAYYGNPSARTMEGKEWKGAELIFDLDADHIHGEFTYKEMLARVKEETVKLIDDFLIADFGFTEKELEIVFSGGRGYHVHIDREDVIALGSNERREIVDYLKGNGLNFEKTFPINCHDKFSGCIVGGWGRRIAKRVEYNLNGLNKLDNAIATKQLKDNKFTAVQRQDIMRVCSKPELISKVGAGVLMNKGVIALARKTIEYDSHVLAVNCLDEASPAIDNPVSADTHRLIRMPGSLHGGSSLLTKRLSRKELDTFEPLCDAVYFGEEPCRIVLNKDSEVELGDKKYKLSTGAGSVPLCVAMHLMCRGAAEYAP